MLLTFKQMDFLSKTIVQAKNGMLKAKDNLTDKEKEELLAIDNANVMTYGEHLVEIETL